jgi:hypothetical protein
VRFARDAGAVLTVHERHNDRSSDSRAFDGCLGIERRRKTWHAAISRGEGRAPFDPWISEWGNPPSKLDIRVQIERSGLRFLASIWRYYFLNT